MNDDELAGVIRGQLTAEADLKNDYIDATSVTLAIVVLAYAAAIFWWGRAIWNPTGVHAAALAVPGAPQTWGALFAVLGAAAFVSALRRWKGVLVISTGLLTVVFAWLAVMVFQSSDAYPRNIGQIIWYAGFSLLFLHRARLALRS